jgi:hypothetical protein
MSTADHATHGLSDRIRALGGTSPRQSHLNALAAEVDGLQQRLADAEARLRGEDDGTAAEAPARIQVPAPMARAGDVYTHG